MKRKNRLLIAAVLVAGLVAQNASAVLVTNKVRAVRGIGLGINYGTPPTFTKDYGLEGKVGVRIDNAPVSKYAWLGWDLSATWSFYGQTNLVNASFTKWGENGTGRDFRFAALKDLGLDGWDQNLPEFQYTNAPGAKPVNLSSEPDPAAGVNGNKPPKQQLDWPKIYNGTNLWEVNSGTPAVTADLARVDLGANFDQCARYTTPDVVQSGLSSLTVNSNLIAWLKTDTDGSVTLIGIGGGNQSWWIGTNGQYAGDIAAGRISLNQNNGTYGDMIRDTPTLTLIFDIRVAVGGGGIACPGGSGPEIFLGGTDVGFNYLLYTNDVYTGQKIVGDGAAHSFGPQNMAATYTVYASNTTTTVTQLIPGTRVISYYSAPGFTNQSGSITAATNSVAVFEVGATNYGGGLTYQWYRNGVSLNDNGRITGTSTDRLLISPVLASDAATTANGYYCVVANPCGVSVVSATNALTIQTARNLVWRGSPTTTWNIGVTTNWFNSGTSANDAFNQGDNLLLDDTAIAPGLAKASAYLAPGTIYFNHSSEMGIGGSGSIFGPNSSLFVNGYTENSHLILSNANNYAGGTTISNGWLTLNNLGAAGSGTITMAGTASFIILELNATGGPDFGIPGVNVLSDSYLQFDLGGTYAGSIVGPLTGTPGKKLTFYRPASVVGDNFRLWHTNFTCDINIDLQIGSASFAPYNSSGVQTYNGVISGTGRLYTRHGGLIILNAANTFSGGVVLSGGTTAIGNNQALSSGNVGIEGNSGFRAEGGDRTISNPIYYTNSGTMTFSGTNVLTLTGGWDLGSGNITSAANRIISLSTGTKTVISGVINDSSGFGSTLTKSGGGTLFLNVANTYTGTTTNSAGVLAGTGSIAGSVVVTGGGVGGGSVAAIGTLSVGGNVTFNGGGAFIRVNRSGLQSDKVSVSGTLSASAAGTITVTNLGAALQAGDNFVLFPGKTVTGGSALAVTGAGMLWTNKLEVDGSIQVIGVAPTTNPNATNITMSVTAGTLNLSWPSDHTGWNLQAQTNTLGAGLGTNWTTIGYANTNSVSFPINPANPSVFYRLFYVAP